MNAYAKSADAYLVQRIMGASPEQQAALIMEAGQLHMGRAIHAMGQNNMSAAFNSFIRVSEVIMEATVRLDLEEGGELAHNLKKLYDWWSWEIKVASKSRDRARLEAVARDMGEIRMAWEQYHTKKSALDGQSDLLLRDRVV
ncbi:flagellar export chaperone FliS [Geothrix sp. PMB-07]|uniref:flagellar export chaperone FliS n=1 Tax=Geothrix sp. PMB-07 TaxID=3068640 RepID=UPI0027423762|nr:flagellar export chaperone FliS [Geothrix sp. PMB-07]WLT31807.1 flagellar export chaperone FliS [Geothrix sp. PMB-07]